MDSNRSVRVGPSAAVIGAILVAPLLFLSSGTTRRTRASSDYAVLFGVLWLLPTAFVMMAMPIMRGFSSGQTAPQRPAALALRIALLVVVAVMWLSIVSDQLPCFMGKPNCD